MLTIYSLCDYSGEWGKPYREAGYKVVAVDIKTGQDVRLLLCPKEPVHGVLAAPPCTIFAGSGARFRSLRAISEILEGLSVVDACIRFAFAVKPIFFALENPVGWLQDYIGPYIHTFNPCDYGDPYTKRTHLWGWFNIPEKTSVEPTEGNKPIMRYGGRSERTKTMRSITPPGFARAFFEANR